MSNIVTPAALFSDEPASTAATKPLEMEILPPPASNLPAAIAPTASNNLPTTLTTSFVDNYGKDLAQKTGSVTNAIMKSLDLPANDAMTQKLGDLVMAAKGMDPSHLRKAGGLIGKMTSFFHESTERLLAQFRTVEGQINTLTTELAPYAVKQRQRIADFDALFDENVQTYQYLDHLIIDGRAIVAQESAAIETVGTPSDPMQAQLLSDRKARLTRFEDVIKNLDIQKTIALQSGPELRVAQENARRLVTTFENLQTAGVPLYTKAFTKYLLQLEAKDGAQVANAVGDAINQGLILNSDLTKQNATQIAKLANRDVVDIETVEHLQQNLISMADEMKQIEVEAAAHRKEVTKRLGAMNTELVARLTA